MYLRILWLLILIPCYGQNYKLKTIPILDEFNTYHISTPFIDSNGFIWYGIDKEGVFYRFDGKNKIKLSFSEAQEKGFFIAETMMVSNWYQEKDGTIWALNLKGVYVIKPKTFKINQILWDELTDNRYCNTRIIQDKYGNIWISNGSDYILKIDKQYRQKKFKSQFLSERKRHFEIVKELENGKILVQSDKDLFVVKDKDIQFFENYSAFSSSSKNNFQIIDNGKIFPKNTSGYYNLNGKAYKYHYIKIFNIQIFDYPFDNFIYLDSKLISIHKNNIIINNVDAIDKKITSIDTVKTRGDINPVHLIKDHNNIIWFSSHRQAQMLKVSDNTELGKHLKFYARDLSTRGIISDSKDNLYIGSYAGLYKLSTKNPFFENIFTGYYSSLIMENDSVVWVIGTEKGNFLKKVNLKSKKTEEYLHLEERVAFYFIKQKSVNDFWMGTDKGLYVFNKKTKSITKKSQEIQALKNFAVYDLLETSDGTIWLGTNKGLYVKEKVGPFKKYNIQYEFFDDRAILTLYEDSNKNIWIGTNFNGVAQLNPQTKAIKFYNQSDGLSNNTVCGILESRERMWFATFYGLSSLNKLDYKQFDNFYEEDGLLDNEFNRGSVYKKKDTTFFFGGVRGIIGFNPEKVAYKVNKFTIFLSSLEYSDEEQQKSKRKYASLDNAEIYLPYENNFFSAEFAINDMFNYDKNIYFYKIDGLTNGWVDIGTAGIIKLYGIPPGDYILTVKGKSINGVETVNQIKIPINVRQIFFKTPFFIVLSIILIIVCLTYFYRRSIKKQKKDFDRRKEIIQFRSSTLTAQMNPDFVFKVLNNMQKIFTTKGEREVNKYFVAFSKILRLTIDISKIESIKLESEIEYTNNYLFLNNLLMEGELNYKVIIADEVNDKKSMTILGMIVLPFVENAIVYGLAGSEKDKNLTVRYSIEKKYLVVNIEDNGIGREASRSKLHNPVNKSWSIKNVYDRINVINNTNQESITVEIKDLKDGLVPTGTKAVIRFKIKQIFL